MANAVCAAAQIKCSFGSAPSVLNVLPVNLCMSKLPLANTDDNKPLLNILPFGTCSVSQPPIPCLPTTSSPWLPGSPIVQIGGKPALHDSCILMCAKGGIIEFISAGQTSVTVG